MGVFGGGGGSGGGGDILPGVAVGKSLLMDDARGRAAHYLKEAIKKLQYIDLGEYRKAAAEGDRKYYTRWLNILKNVAPDLFKIREESGRLFLDALEPNQKADILGEKLFEEARGGVPEDLKKYGPIVDQLLGRAKETLDLGDRLSPEQQNLLVTSGLEDIAQSGVGVDRSGPAGSYIARLLGTTSEGLRASRANQAAGVAQNAQSLASGVDILRNNRLNILSGLMSTFSNVNAAKANLAGAGQAFALNNAPKAGLMGSDILNMMEANRQQKNQANMNIAGVNAQRSIDQGEMWSSILDTVDNAAQTALSVYTASLSGGAGGMGAGATAGTAGGGFNWGRVLSGLMGTQAQPQYIQGFYNPGVSGNQWEQGYQILNRRY